eukprot:14372606-Alexandrium_andersonii.AAC.1
MGNPLLPLVQAPLVGDADPRRLPRGLAPPRERRQGRWAPWYAGNCSEPEHGAWPMEGRGAVPAAHRRSG